MAPAAADGLFDGGTSCADLQAFFEHTVRGLVFLRGRFLDAKGSGCGSSDEEVAVEAFPRMETRRAVARAAAAPFGWLAEKRRVLI